MVLHEKFWLHLRSESSPAEQVFWQFFFQTFWLTQIFKETEQGRKFRNAKTNIILKSTIISNANLFFFLPPGVFSMFAT